MKPILSTAPHVKTRRTTKHIMLDVLIALLPATVAGIVYFGLAAAVTVAVALASAFLTEFVWYLVQNKFHRAPKETLKKFFAQFDFTSLITGLLLALCLPANLSAWYMPALGAIFAVGAVKIRAVHCLIDHNHQTDRRMALFHHFVQRQRAVFSAAV